MAGPSLLSRLGPDRGTLRVWEGRYRSQGRLYVRFSARDAADFDTLLASFRSHFPRHGDALYNRNTRCWSLPPTHTRRLYEWASRHFEERSVRVDGVP